MRWLSKRASALLSVVLIGLSGTVLTLPETTAQERIARDYVNGEVLVKFKPGVLRRAISGVLDHAGLRIAKNYQEIGLLKCAIKGRRSVARAVEKCNDSRDILYAEPNYIYRTMIEPNDPRRRDMYGLTNIDAPLAWDQTTGSEAIVVGVIDTGVDDEHEDLARNIWINQGEFGEGREANGIDDDDNGFVDDFMGWDFLNEDNDPFDDNDHGTHVSGTIGAVGNNELGVVGVNWTVSIMPLKFLDADGSGATDDAIEAIIYGVNMGAKVLSNSWGGGFSQALQDAVEFANDRGVLFVAAAGNESTNNDALPTYPASFAAENVISVAATTSGDNLSGFSNFGEETVDLGAPGSDILSTLANDRYGFFSGTSMATPHVSGAAALVIAQFPNISMRHLKIRLLGSVDDISNLNELVSTGGRLNVNNAFTESPVIANTTSLENTLDEFGPYVVESDVIDDNGLRTVMLTYQLEGAEAIAEVMTSAGADHYRGEIPGQPLGSNLEYVVAATDEDGNVTRGRTFSFSIAEPPPDDDGRICRFDAIEVGLRNSKWQTTVNIVANLSFFILPIICLRKRVRRQGLNS